MSYDNYEVIDSQPDVSTLSRSFFANVYKYMFFALAVTGLVSWYASQSDWYLPMMFTQSGMSGVGWVVTLAPLGLVILIQARFRKMSSGAIMGIYLLYSILLGLSLAWIFLIFTSSSIAITFFVTAGAFGSMALLGYFTKTDLSKFGSLMYMLFIGMFIAGLANMFMQSDAIGYVISFMGLFVFTGLTAWEMQRMKAIAQDTTLTTDDRKKMELIGGLTLYILFINLFMSILHFTGDR
jgi:FtsH-binding integral membrane protein